MNLLLKVKVKVQSLRSDIYTYSTNHYLAWYRTHVYTTSNLISPGRIHSVRLTSMMPAWVTQSQFSSTRYPSLLGRQVQYGMRCLSGTSTHDQQWKSNSRSLILNPTPFRLDRMLPFMYLTQTRTRTSWRQLAIVKSSGHLAFTRVPSSYFIGVIQTYEDNSGDLPDLTWPVSFTDVDFVIGTYWASSNVIHNAILMQSVPLCIGYLSLLPSD